MIYKAITFKWPVGQVVKTPPFHGGITGSNPVRVTIFIINITDLFGGLAQLGEHLPYKQGVGGSSPSSSTITPRGGAVWQLVGLITQRSQVQILPPQPII